MISEVYRQSPEFRAEAIRQAEHARLVQAIRPAGWLARLFARAAK